MTETRNPRQTRETAKKLGWLTEAQAATGWGLIIILAAIVGAIYLNQASKIASIGREIQVQQSELDKKRLENAILERRIAEAQSLERLNAEAIRMGFVPARPENIEYVVIPNYPVEPLEPLTETPVAAAEVPAELPDSMLEAIKLALRNITSEMIQGQAYEQ